MCVERQHSSAYVFRFVVVARFVAVAMYFAVTCGTVARGDEAMKAFLVEGMADRGDNLKSASFTATGVIESSIEGVALGTIQLNGAFDSSRLRFDYVRSGYIIAPEKLAQQLQKPPHMENQEAIQGLPDDWLTHKLPETDMKDLVRADIGTYFIRTPEKVAYWHSLNPTVFLLAANSNRKHPVVQFDVKALGLYGWIEFRAGLELRELLAEYRKNENYEVNDLGGGIWRLTFVFPGDNYSSSRWEIDIDTLNGFTPIESKLKQHLKRSGQTFVPQASKVTWKQHGRAWVPHAYRIENRDEVSGTHTAIDLTFRFDSVNEELDDSLFDYASFPTPDFAAVIDSSSSKPVVVRQHFEGLVPKKRFPQSAARTSRLVTMLGVTALAGGLVYLVVSWHRRRYRGGSV